jgi:beta-N-acetylhexosaminidase
VRRTKLIALVTGVALAVAAVVVFAASAAARRTSSAAQGGGVSTTSKTDPGSGRHGAGRKGQLTPVSAAIGLSAAAVSPSALGIATAKAVLPKLTALQLAGQRVIYSYSGLTPPAALYSAIRQGQVAGVIFFSGNIGTTTAELANFRAVVGKLKAADAAPSNPVRLPLLLMTDQEGGEVRRLPGAPRLSEKQIGLSSNPAAAAASAGTGAARNLLSFGLNLNLAPVLDVFRTPGDFDDEFQRSYSSNPQVVAKLGTDFVTAQQYAGVAATVKHFPGLGAATKTQNTDAGPVTLNLTLSQIRTIDELPYKSAIAAEVKLVMVSWARYPSLDKKFPAGLSSKIVQGELRNRLDFGGVTITDALEAGALKSFGSIANRSTLAAHAGMDLLLCAEGKYQEGSDATHTLAADFTSGKLNASRFKAAAERVLALRATLADG